MADLRAWIFDIVNHEIDLAKAGPRLAVVAGAAATAARLPRDLRGTQLIEGTFKSRLFRLPRAA